MKRQVLTAANRFYQGEGRMKKPQQINDSWPGMRENLAFMAVGRAHADAMLQAHAEVMKQIEDMHKAWFSTAKEATESATDLANRCVKCSSPGEAAGLYSEWVNQRMEQFFTDSRRFADQLLTMYDSAMTPLKAAQTAAQTATQNVASGAEEPATVVAQPIERARAAGD
ncbi:MAG TPA: phasin family protein [Candidatus Cybelea sp.]|nr:phasin family protein [Candidatus Cybelea sp.]